MSDLEGENADLRRQLRAAEDRAIKIETEAQEMYENANAQLQKSLENAQERVAQLERENGTLALTVSYLRAQLGRAPDEPKPRPVAPIITTVAHEDKAPPFSPMKTAHDKDPIDDVPSSD